MENLKEKQINDLIYQNYHLEPHHLLFIDYVLNFLNIYYGEYDYIFEKNYNLIAKKSETEKITENDSSFVLEKLQFEFRCIDKHHKNEEYKLNPTGKEIIEKYKDFAAYLVSETDTQLSVILEQQKKDDLERKNIELQIENLVDTKSRLHIKDQLDQLEIKNLKGNIFQLKYWWLVLLFSFLLSIIGALITQYIKDCWF